jgi:predicted glycosyltransferase
MVFADATRQGAYDLVVGDEAWEVFKFLHYNPSMKTAPFVFITDFIGTTNVSDDEIKKTHVQDINGSWVEMHEIHPEASDLSIFLGDIEDVPDIQFGEGMPNRRTWAREHFKFPGYVFSFDPACYSDKHALRRELGFLPEEKILLIAVGGTSVGRPLIEKCLEIHADLKVRVPRIRTVVLSGPRIDPKSFGEMEGVDFLPFIQDPIKLFAACDLAVIQAGLSTAMELVALNRPFLYFPLKDHFEQQHLVDLRLKRLRAGIRMDFDSTGPSQFVEAISTNISKPADYKAISQDAAKRVADMILALLSENGEV